MIESGFCIVFITLPNMKNELPRSPLLRIFAGIFPLSFLDLVFRFSLSSVETHRFLTICSKILFLNKKVHRISSVDNVNNYALFYYCFSTLKRISKRVSGTAICTTCFVNPSAIELPNTPKDTQITQSTFILEKYNQYICKHIYTMYPFPEALLQHAIAGHDGIPVSRFHYAASREPESSLCCTAFPAAALYFSLRA